MGTQVRRVRLGVSTFASLLLAITVMCVVTATVDAQQFSDNVAVNSGPSNNSIHRLWQIGGLAMGGLPPSYELRNPILSYHEELDFYSAGLEAGRMVTAVRGSNFIKGRGEAIVEIFPYWQVNHPAQTVTVYVAPSRTPSFLGGVGAYSVHGASVTPFLLRWNFMKKDTNRLVPWVQLGSGLVWTSQIFPQGYGNPLVKTSRINFTPQVGFGENFFVRKKQSINLGVRAVHITNFGLTTYDPGVNVVLEFTAGYSWWK
jgi:lipid A 3-O-deacylase